MTNFGHSPSATSRLQFIDLLRGWAVFVMIETHVVNALLRLDLKGQSFFAELTFVNGLVAPSFLFCAGLALAITIQRKWRAFLTFQSAFWRYTVRLLFILLVGYSLHLPFFSLTKLKMLSDEQAWIPFFQVDILQTIAVTLFVLVLLVVMTRSERVFLTGAVAVAIGAVFVAPIVRERDLSSLPIWFRPYLTTQFRSQFPLFPWSAFLIAGTVIGYFFLRARKDGWERTFVRRLTLAAAGGIVIAMLAEVLPFTVYRDHSFWRASPEFFFVRLGLVVLAFACLWLYEQRRQVSPHSVFTLFGRESLLVYVVHLLIVYGYTYEFSFIRYFGTTLNYLECIGLFLGLTVAMYLLAFTWHWLKDWNKQLAWFLEAVMLSTVALEFLVRQS